MADQHMVSAAIAIEGHLAEFLPQVCAVNLARPLLEVAQPFVGEVGDDLLLCRNKFSHRGRRHEGDPDLGLLEDDGMGDEGVQRQGPRAGLGRLACRNQGQPTPPRRLNQGVLPQRNAKAVDPVQIVRQAIGNFG